MKKQQILFIGAGRMAEAIFSGLLKRSVDDIESITISNQSNRSRLLEMHQKYGVQTTTNWRNEVNHADVILLALPPYAHESLLAELSPLLDNQFVITIAAGIGPSYLEERLPSKTPVSWIMPNTAAVVGESMSLYCLGRKTTDHHRKVLQMILQGIGNAEECTEEEIHQLTAVTGSAPAFVYYFAESLIQTTKELGISEEKAKQLVIQMIYGSAAMLREEQDPASLREQVTTPGGSTAEGLRVLYEKQFSSILQQAIAATNEKARN
ncbi:pyrroline-5-carboxylate reductase [Ectobacillus sp. sgz5001026]|uniref:pyrroline-5-carboxylate reductase n=1 Tax=Ectobacillus sp. sgz5001026 TaxID=3242473 RepID=UPI0036D43E7F